MDEILEVTVNDLTEIDGPESQQLINKRKRRKAHRFDDYFDRIKKDGVPYFKCKCIKEDDGLICNKEYKGPTTTSAINHMEKKHKREYGTCINVENQDQADQQLTQPFNQGMADRMFARLIGPSTISLRQASSVEFRNFAMYLNPDYRSPSRQTLVKNILTEANRASELIKQLLARAPKIHVSTDLWTQRKYRRSYASVNAHIYINQLDEQATICLGIKEVFDHKAVTIYQAVAEILEKYDQRIDEIGVINTDNAKANICAFRNEYLPAVESTEAINQEGSDDMEDAEINVEDLDEIEPISLDDVSTHAKLTAKWIGCADHTLQLALQIIEDDQKFVQVRDGMVSILRSIGLSVIAVRDFQALSGRSIVLPNTTRWNTNYLCLRMAYECFEHIMTIASDRKMENYKSLNTQEIYQYLGQVVRMLKITYLATKDLEGDKSSTIALVVPTILNVLLELQVPEPSDAFSKLGDLPKQLAKEISSRFAYAIDPKFSGFSPLLSAASLLHPECCTLLPVNLVDEGKEEIGRWISRLPMPETSAPIQLVQESRFGRLASQSSSESSRSWKSLLDNYLKVVLAVSKIEPYKFWSANMTNFPQLAMVARQILPAPATSASCERDFSFTGLFTESRKSNTSPINLNAKLILAANKEIIQILDPIE